MLTYLALIIFIIVVLIVWWALMRNAKKYKPDFETHPHEEAHPEAEEHVEEAAIQPVEDFAVRAAAIEPAVEAPVIPLQPDDLTIVEGIGPKINQLLHDAGILTFAQLAGTDASKLREILDPAGLRFVDPSSWAEQARLLAENKHDELKALQERLKAGRTVE